MPRITIKNEFLRHQSLTWLIFIFLAACANPNPEAPAQGNSHVSDFLLSHAVEADEDLNPCMVCHRDDLRGTGPETDCMVCHDPATSLEVHQTPYTDAGLHGQTAKSNLLLCFGCHGTPPISFDGGIVSDPDLFNKPNGNCSAADCHPSAGAHPTRWQGENDLSGDYLSSHRSAGNQKAACGTCHDYIKGRTAPDSRAPSCFSADFTNSDGSATACHPEGPATPPHDLPYATPQAHGTAAKDDLAACQTCHGELGTIHFDGGSAATSCSTSPCHPSAGAHPTRWQGSNDISGSYLSSHRTAGNKDTNCVICHDYTQGRTAPNSQAPSCFSASFTNADGSTTTCHPDGGGSAPHDLPYTSPQSHGAASRADLSYCQTCHGTVGTTRFDGGIASTSCSTAQCHPAAGAHPTRWQGENDNTLSYRSSHRNSGNRSVSCRICHDYTSGRAAPNPDAPSCFTSSFTNADGVTSGCHDD